MPALVLRFCVFVLLAAYLITPLGLKYTTFTLALACYASFAWASKRFFQRLDGTHPVQRRVLFCTYATATLHGLAILYRNHGTIYHTLVGIALYIACLMLFWSAVRSTQGQGLQLFFSTRAPSSLVQSGPYREVRHPFYTAYTLAWIGGTIATNQHWLSLTVLAAVAIYRGAAILEESQFARSDLAWAYRRYQRRTGMFLPLLTGLDPVTALFRPALIRTGRAMATTAPASVTSPSRTSEDVSHWRDYQPRWAECAIMTTPSVTSG